MRKRLRPAAWIVVVVVVAIAVVAVVWFQPQKLLIDETADEAVPRAAASTDAKDPSAGKKNEPAPETIASGEFQSLEHTTTGTASVIELADGRRFLRFEGLETSNGPDLRVYLSEVPASDDWHAYGEDFVDLGALKANLGDQNYEIPNDVDLDDFKSAVIWCRRFTVGFGVAPLDT